MRTMSVVYGRLPFELGLVELEPAQSVERDGYAIAAIPVAHGERTAFGYALIEADRPGEFDPRAAEHLGITPGEDFGRLQHGETVDGVRPEQVMGPPREGRKVVFSGDTAPCEALVLASHRADVLVHEATFADAESQRARETSHSTARQAAERLGLVVPAWRHVILALAVAGLFLGLSQASDILSHSLTPDIARRVDSTTQHVFGQLGGPLGIAALALLPGICEEVLFRGALQPRIGVLATALLFTSIHTEYGLSIDTLAVFVLALGLGFVRKYTNTTTSCACHVSYNLLVGIGIAGAALNVALVLEVVLIAVSAYAIWRHR